MSRNAICGTVRQNRIPLGVVGDLHDHRGSPAIIIEYLDRDDAFGAWVVKNDNAHADLRT